MSRNIKNVNALTADISKLCAGRLYFDLYIMVLVEEQLSSKLTLVQNPTVHVRLVVKTI